MLGSEVKKKTIAIKRKGIIQVMECDERKY
jgi:hypothetical protein